MQNFENGTNGVEETVVANNLVPKLGQPVGNLSVPYDEREDYRCLDATGRDRFNILSQFYSDDDCFHALGKITSYGINTFNSVKSKISFIASNGHDNEYYSSIINFVQIDTLYKTASINRFIGDLRKSLNFPPYLTNIDKSCARDFLMLFMAEVTLSDWDDVKTKKPFPIGYTPTFYLNCQR